MPLVPAVPLPEVPLVPAVPEVESIVIVTSSPTLVAVTPFPTKLNEVAADVISLPSSYTIIELPLVVVTLN